MTTDPTESGWYGSAFTADSILHADARLVGPGSVQVTFTPAATEGGPGVWVTRLRSGADHHGTDKLAQLAECLAESRECSWAQNETVGLVYRPRVPDDQSGSIARVRVGPGGEPEWLREMVLPLYLFEDMGRNLRTLAAVAARSVPADAWEPEPCVPCTGCERPIFESMDTAFALGVEGLPPAAAMCPACTSGETLRHIRQIPDGRFPRQRSVLEAFERSASG